MLPKLSTPSSLTVENFFGLLFQIRDQIHLMHLKETGIGSYARHVALGGFYDSLLSTIDSLVESYQGKYGLINITIPKSSNEDGIKTISKLALLVDNGTAYNLFKETWIKNELDSLSLLCYQTLYKLKNLK